MTNEEAESTTNNIPKTCGSCEHRRVFTPEGFCFANCQLKRDLGYKNSLIYDKATKGSGNLYARVYNIRDKDCPLEKRIKESTIVEKPFDWNYSMSEIALEDFAIALGQKSLPYGTCQTIGMALAKLQLLEKQGAKVKEKLLSN